ncbi:MAG: methyltransferase domain-containing protein [Nostoc sp. NMS4]|nr:methyltransferase domain-containing protein [Nostoc sp. NMS4]
MDLSVMNRKRSESFNEVAEIYDAARPSYPSQLIEDVIEMANLPDSASILDIGTGTGKGTVPFAEKGYAISCLEPGERLIAIASQNMRLYPKVTFETVTLEDWNLRPKAFDLAISAQAFHWVNREKGYPKVAQALKEKGYIAFFWNFSILPDTSIFQALKETFKKYVSTTISNAKPSSVESLIKKRENWILNSFCFKNLVVKQYPWSIDYDAERYLGLLKTQTAYQEFTETEKQDFSDAIIQILNAHGGYVTKPYLSVLFFAQKI